MHVLHEEIGSPPAGTLVNPMTTVGDIIVGGTVSGGVAAPARLGIGASTTVLHGGTTPGYSAVVEGDLSLSAITTGNVNTSRHGFAPILPNDATKYLDGMGAYTSPPGGTHYLVISSSHSTPLIFGDLVQTSDGSDLIYTS